MSAALQQNPQILLKLSVVKGPHTGQVFQLYKEKITMGRGPENDVVLMNDPQVSRLHAQLVLVDHDFEIVKISQKNSVMVGSESIDRWKLVSGTTFVLGESEVRIEYDLGKAVVSVPNQRPADVIPLKNLEATNVVPNPHALVPSTKVAAMTAPTAPIPTASIPVAPHQVPIQSPAVQMQQAVVARPGQPQMPMTSASNQQLVQQQQQMMMQQQQAFRLAQQQAQQARSAQQAAPKSFFENPKVRFYLIAVILIGGVVLFLMGPQKPTKPTKPKAILKYEDEIAIKLNSTPEKELVKKREEKKLDRKSPQYLRAQENFVRGMRDFGLGNYARAQEFFLLVLNLDPDNQVAKRYYTLSRIRFDELVQAKLMLGESYYSKHNFSMCLSMYQQVMNMLSDKRTDTKYKLAERKAKECELAIEGIR